MWWSILALAVVVVLYLMLLVSAVLYLPDELDGPEDES
jgi:hypothetical protein